MWKVFIADKSESLEVVFKKFLKNFIANSFFFDKNSYPKKDEDLSQALLEVFLDDKEHLAMKTISRECLLCLLRKRLTAENLKQYQRVKQYLGLMR